MGRAYRCFDYATQYKDFESTVRYLKEQKIKFTYSKGIGDTGTQYYLYVDKRYEDYLW